MIKNLYEKYDKCSVVMKASIWFLICSFLQKGISVITTPIFTRLLTTWQYGMYNVFDSWLSIISIIVTLNLSFGVYVQGLIKYEDEKDLFSSSLQGLNLLLCFVWTVMYFMFHKYINGISKLSTTQMILMFLIIWTSSVFNFWAAEQRVDYKYHLLVFISLIVSVLKPVIGVWFVLKSDDKVTARILGIVLVNLLIYPWMFLYQVRKGKKLFCRKFWKYSLSYNIPLIPHYLSQTILNNSDRIMINFYIGEDKSGIYSLAYSIAMLMTLFNLALAQTLNPWIFTKIKEKRISDITPVAYISIIVVMVLNLLLIIVAPEAVRLFAPEEYYEAIYCIPPIAMGVPFLFSYELFAKFAFYYEKTRFVMVASMGGAILNIIMNIWGIKIWGYIAAAYTTLICYILYAILHYIFMKVICKRYMNEREPYNVKVLLALSIIFLAMGTAIMYIYEYSVIRYSIIFAIILLVIFQKKRLFQILKRISNLK